MCFRISKQFSKIYEEKYVLPSRRRISQLQTSTLQPSVAKQFAELRSKVVSSLSWSGFVTKWRVDRVKLL